MGNSPCCSGASKDNTSLDVENSKKSSPILAGNDLQFTAQEAEPQGAAALQQAKTAGGNEGQKVTYPDGSTYVGSLLDGVRDGHGTLTTNSEQYVGQWKADQQHGEGRLTWSDGRAFEGQFSQGKFNGKGKMTWRTEKGPMTYEGEYQDDLKHGQGRFTWPDGRVYDGGWAHGKRHGNATYTVRGTTFNEVWDKDECVRRDGEPPKN